MNLPEEAPTAVSTAPELAVGDGVDEDVAVFDVEFPVGTMGTKVDSDPSVRTNMPVVTEYSIWQNARKFARNGILLLPPPLVFCLIQERQFS